MALLVRSQNGMNALKGSLPVRCQPLGPNQPQLPEPTDTLLETGRNPSRLKSLPVVPPLPIMGDCRNVLPRIQRQTGPSNAEVLQYGLIGQLIAGLSDGCL